MSTGRGTAATERDSKRKDVNVNEDEKHLQ